MIEIVVNGRRRDVDPGLTLESLLAALELPPGRVAVERNRRVVPHGSFATEPVEPGDCFEVVTLVGGG
ncbi:MAG TPA: sulfur carrier protein ThiS [Candidatus Polarisedimenticolia bacterium]|jgi:thiamine biosynthesis protein ThiS